MKTLPKSLSRLSDLTRLDVGQNDMMEIPEVVGQLTSLNELWMDSNNLVSVPHVSVFAIGCQNLYLKFKIPVHRELEAIKLPGTDQEYDC